MCAEAEVKVELSRREFARLPGTLTNLGFSADRLREVTDYYLAKEALPHGGWDFERLRWTKHRGWWLTRKRWRATGDGKWVRTEYERRLPRAQGMRLARGISGDSVLRKTRHDFRGSIAGPSALVSLDELELGGRRRYFLECEVKTSVAHYEKARAMIWKWLTSSLSLSDRAEAPSMLEMLMAHEKAGARRRETRRTGLCSLPGKR